MTQSWALAGENGLFLHFIYFNKKAFVPNLCSSKEWMMVKNRNKFSTRINVALGENVAWKDNSKGDSGPWQHWDAVSQLSFIFIILMSGEPLWRFNILAEKDHCQTKTCKQSFHHNVFKYLSLPGLNGLTSSKLLHPFLQNPTRRQNSSGNTKERSLYCIYIQYLIAAPDTSPVGRWRTLDDDRQEVVRIMWFTETKPTQ